jgi:hypothetical protein
MPRGLVSPAWRHSSSRCSSSEKMGMRAGTVRAVQNACNSPAAGRWRGRLLGSRRPSCLLELACIRQTHQAVDCIRCACAIWQGCVPVAAFRGVQSLPRGRASWLLDAVAVALQNICNSKHTFFWGVVVQTTAWAGDATSRKVVEGDRGTGFLLTKTRRCKPMFAVMVMGTLILLASDLMTR